MSAREVWVCRDEELGRGEVRCASLGVDGEGRPIQAMVLRNEAGSLVAYRNLCRHLPVPLDGGTGDLLTEDREHLVCGTHGATYRVGDGVCVEGPCEGAALEPLHIRVDSGDVYVSRLHG